MCTYVRLVKETLSAAQQETKLQIPDYIFSGFPNVSKCIIYCCNYLKFLSLNVKVSFLHQSHLFTFCESIGSDNSLVSC